MKGAEYYDYTLNFMIIPPANAFSFLDGTIFRVMLRSLFPVLGTIVKADTQATACAGEEGKRGRGEDV